MTKLKTLTYWICRNLSGHDAYAIRASTRAEAAALRKKNGSARWAVPVKVEVQYLDPLHLLIKCLGEDGGGWERS